MRDVSIQRRLKIGKEAWPPEPPQTFTPLICIQQQQHVSSKQSTAMAETVELGLIDNIASTVSVPNPVVFLKHKENIQKPLQEVLDASKVTKDIAEILAPLEKKSSKPPFILVEGAPGIGKSSLLKEIAYLWGTKQVLQRFKLVLLVCLRDPAVQQMSSIDDLLQLFCKRDKRAAETASACSDYLSENSGEDLAFLFDGYDEYPEKFREDSLIADILEREVLPLCSLILSSRPDACGKLRYSATVKVDILGFTEAEREYFIKESMKGQPKKVDELKQYLQSHLTISNLCFIPFNLVVLVYLYKQGISLPKNSAELYNYFICLAVCRRLNKQGHSHQSNITKLTDLPEPYNKIIQQLSKLSLEALNNNKLIFTFDEIKAACPDILATEGAINGFGLLQAVEHSGITGMIKTFNFLHFSIQEYLAAHYIVNLPDDEELQIIEKKFWSHTHFNMFLMYITLTKGQKPSFKHFLCDGALTISNEVLKDVLQCLHLYSCFCEAGDLGLCKTIEQSEHFKDKELQIHHPLTPADVECVSLFLTSSLNQEWARFDLYFCYIQDCGLCMLHRVLLHRKNITIDNLGLGYNGLTARSSSLIVDIAVKCKVKKLRIIGNHHIGEDDRLFSILSNPSSMVDFLNLYDTHLSSREAITLFTAVKDDDKLKRLDVDYNDITDDACYAIAAALERNSCLDKLYLYDNPLTCKGMLNIMNGLKANNVLRKLGLPECPEDIKKTFSSLQDFINKKRKSKGCQVELKVKYFAQ